MTDIITNQDFNPTYTKVTRDYRFDNATGQKITIFGDLSIENDIFATNNGMLTSPVTAFELLSKEANSDTDAVKPTTINIGSSKSGPLVTTNIQGIYNTIGHGSTSVSGYAFTSGQLAVLSFNQNQTSEGAGSGFLFLNNQIIMESTLNTRPLKLSSFTGFEWTNFRINDNTDQLLADYTINSSNYAATATTAQATLPPANVGSVVVYEQSVPITGLFPLIIYAATNDIFATGSLAPNPIYTSDAFSDPNDKILIFVASGSPGHYFGANSLIIFQCVKKVGVIGTWFIEVRAIPDRVGNEKGQFTFL